MNEIEVNREEIAWAAGFFDGEGSIGYRLYRGHANLRMSVWQNDRRALDRFHRAILGLGKVYGPNVRVGINGRPHEFFDWRLSGRYVISAFAVLWTFIGPVKRAQGHRAITSYLEATKGRRTWIHRDKNLTRIDLERIRILERYG